MRDWQHHRAMTNFVGTYHSKYFNEVDGVRQTSHQPTGAQHNIYMLGSSNLYNSELPDDQTIASQLQVLLNTKMEESYRVVNLGTNGAAITQQSSTLKQLNLARGDVVIFYDGFQEAASVYWPFVRQRSNLPYEYPCKWLLNALSNSSLVFVSCSWVNTYIPQGLVDPVKLQPSIASVAHNYYLNLLNADSYVRSHGGTFFHFLQPQMWSRSLSSAEQSLAANFDLVPDKLGQITTLTWPTVQATASEAGRRGVNTRDLTHLLDDLRNHSFIFFDAVHINERGNALVAAAMFQAITTL